MNGKNRIILVLPRKLQMEKADVGVGSEKFSQIVNVDFIPIMKEQYDLVILKNKEK